MIPFSVSETAKAFGLEEEKLEIDYNKFRSRNHVLNSKEIAYIKNDVVIMAKAIGQMFEKGLVKMTRASNSLEDFKKIFGKDRFKLFFPELDYETDSDIRQSYKGGFTYLNPTYKEKEVGKGNVIDVNSLYPYCMYEKLLPYGEPVFFEGKYQESKEFPLYIQMITCRFKLKKHMIPTIQIKNSFSFIPNEYLESSNGEIVGLCLTNVDLVMFFRHYEVFDLKFISGYMFKGIHGIFTDFIDKWIKEKIEGTIEKNKGKRTMAKLMLNSLYGKFAKVLKMRNKFPYLGEDEIVHYYFSDYEITDGIYIPIGSFITAYAREKTIETSQKIHEYSLKKYGKSLYYYSDTDSIHTGLSKEELEQFVEIDDVKLGAWALEKSFSKAKFIRQKCYVEVVDDKMEITCSGLPKNCYSQVTWDNFKVGFTCSGKLTFKHVKGGVKLVETDFTIKEEKIKNTIKNLQSII